MNINWIFVVIILICVFVLFIYMIVRNHKDKKRVIDSMNEPKIRDEPKHKDQEES